MAPTPQLLEAAPPVDVEAEAPEPAWGIARLFPAQGEWDELDYLALPDDERLAELSDGRVEVLPVPTQSHEFIVDLLLDLLKAFVRPGGLGRALSTGLRVRLWGRTFRFPDVVFMLAENAGRRHEQYWEGADLAMEVVSGDHNDRRRDLVTKRQEYARASIPEYWIVDPEEQRITVLTLEGSAYRMHGEFGPGSEAASALLPGFAVSVDDVLAAAEE